MARMRYNGYSITELRGYAREYKIAGRSKMSGEALLAAVLQYWGELRISQERELLATVDVKPGTLLRHKSSGDIIRVTGEVHTWQPYGALCVTADYVECSGWGAEDDRRLARAAYQNDQNERTGHVAKHPLWQYEAVTA